MGKQQVAFSSDNLDILGHQGVIRRTDDGLLWGFYRYEESKNPLRDSQFYIGYCKGDWPEVAYSLEDKFKAYDMWVEEY